MTETGFDNRALSPADPARPVTLINTFTINPGKLDEFLAVQDEARLRFAGRVAGFRGSRMYRARNDRTAILITVFETVDHHKAWLNSELFAAHRTRIAPLIERATPTFYDLVYETGEF
jgi:heme-degrading monooxygenase HmoA